MNWLKSLSTTLFGGNGDSPDMLTLDGTLYLARADGVRGGHECLYPDACATLRRTPSPFEYQLVVTRMVDEDDLPDDEGSDDDDAAAAAGARAGVGGAADDDASGAARPAAAAGGDERIFVVHPDMRFHTGRLVDGGEVTPTFRWIEAGGNPDDIYEFAVAPPATVDAPIITVFTQTMAQCLYERANLRTHENAAQEELDAMLFDPAAAAASARRAPASRKSQPKAKSSAAKAAGTTSQQASKETSPVAAKSALPKTPTRPKIPMDDVEIPSPTPRPARTAAGEAPKASKGSKPSSVAQRLQSARDGDSAAIEDAGPKMTLAMLIPRPPPLSEDMKQEIELDAEVYVFNAATREFALLNSGITAQLWTHRAAQDQTMLAIGDKLGDHLLVQPLDMTMNHVFHDAEMALIWNLFVTEKVAGRARPESRGYSLSLKFETPAEYAQFKKAFTTAHIQATLHATLSNMKLSDEDVDYIMEQATDHAPKDNEATAALSDDDEESDREDNGGYGDDDEEDAVDAVDELGAGGHGNDDDDDQYAEGAESAAAAREANSLLTTTKDRTYVVRGGNLGVFGYTARGNVRFETMLSDIKFNKKGLRPDKMMLHAGEKRMIVRDKNDASKLYDLDLGTGSVVEEWSLGEDHRNVSLRDLAPTSKTTDSRAGNDPTFMGITDRSVFRVDTRLRGGVVGDWDDGAYTYSKNMDLSAMATTADAGIAVASGKGELRLFRRPGQRAATALQATGEPIRHLDVSSNGQYVLATCTSYLLLFDVGLADGKTAFQKPMPAKNRPDAIRLQLKPQHVAQMRGAGAAAGAPVHFTSAYFNVSPAGESTIVTSTGPYVVTWTLADVLQRKRKDKYTIKRYAEDVVADQFRFGDDKQIVLALPNDVKSVARSTLKNPDRGL